jgi:hypothetical protein
MLMENKEEVLIIGVSSLSKPIVVGIQENVGRMCTNAQV